MKKLLIIGQVWPEPTSSAAGTRMIQLIDCFQKAEFEITFACAASKSDYSFDLILKGIKEVVIQLNDESFDNFIKQLNPEIVLFDRFMIEEQYGWRVSKECPNALKILDTEDLHFLRNARQEAAKKGIEFTEDLLFSDLAKREIASILRCDLSLMISKKEIEILQNQFKIDEKILYYLPFLENEITEEKINSWKSFEEREYFMFIGNFIHEPNFNCVQTLKKEIWPILRKKLPKAELHIYGAYATQKVLQLNNPSERFLIKSRAENAQETMSNYKVLLAPINFGAGVKGKFVDAMQTGTPSVTTTIGAEAMKDNFDWNGFVEDDFEAFVEKAILLYNNEKEWEIAQQNGIKILNENYNKNKFEADFLEKIKSIEANLIQHRNQNFIGQILQHHHHQSTKYMSLWIEQKNKNLSK
ncbi:MULTISPECIES: glycosyltransferase [Empedobacter]|uniref:glycosyltransferase n=1 Tax=Empedobacter TaxID=59734 RepID=UPI001C58A24D|nr:MULTISPECIES: glycosyltransferase [Empedobacter]MBW1619301.1 glycosyltransferase family 4 protein [Empedobacter falsenii]MDM1139718.1 glycosyltransferase family 4 protein [Empedobacter sp. R132-2]